MSRLRQGGLIDRSRPLSFSFDGRSLAGFAGDTLASALIANDVALVGRSFKYHRPRGIFSAGSEEPNALVELGAGARREPNTRATTVELYDGLIAASQNRWPSLAFDLFAINALLSPLLGAGFYYKTFMWPAKAWEKIYEPAIRRAAGLGRASLEPDPDAYEKAHAFCDVLVIGAGPAGLMAARASARAGARVILADEDFLLGGRLNAERCEVDGEAGSAFAANAVAELASLPNVRVFSRTTVFGVYDSGIYGALERVGDHLAEPLAYAPRQRLWRIVAKRAVLAAGATERPIVFGGNDRPGVMAAQAVQTYLNRFAAMPARQIALFANNDSAWRVGLDIARAGGEAAAIIDIRRAVAPTLTEEARRLGVRILLGGQVVSTSGKRLRSIKVATEKGVERLSVDGLAISGGFSPNLHLAGHHGGRPAWKDDIAAFVPGRAPPGLLVAGAAAGRFGLAACLADGVEKGAMAARDLGFHRKPDAPPRAEDEAAAVEPFWRVGASRGAAFVDFQNDVTAKDVQIAHAEGFRAVEHLKRYTTLGMATDQGKTSNINGHALMADLVGRAVAEVGTTRTRPPHVPIAIGALAGPHVGAHFKPTRYPAGHEWALANGASMVDAGQWHRPRWFTKPGEKDWLESVTREAKTVRAAVGVCDVSTLGKIDIQGRDAGIFLDRVYVNMFSSLAVGKARYGLMLREDGFVLDDGTTARLASDHYVMSTTTGNAAKVMQHLEFCHQVHWPELDVAMVSVTEQWTQYAVAGPKARVLLQNLLGDALDLSNEAFPYMACVEFTWANVPMRLFRLSFSGELAYEIAVPADYGEALLRELMRAGASLGGAPYE